jgi:hypothetical protein
VHLEFPLKNVIQILMTPITLATWRIIYRITCSIGTIVFCALTHFAKFMFMVSM